MTPTVETIDQIPDEVLIYIIRHPNEFSWKYFAVQVIIARLKLKLTMYNDDNSILPGCCDELRKLLKKSISVPSVQEDLKRIVGLKNKINQS